MMNRTISLFAVIAILTLAASPATAQVDTNGIIAVEGTLTNMAGEAVPGPVDLTLGLYTGLDQTIPVWSKVWFDTPLNNGVFQLLLGDEVPLDQVWFEDYASMWIGVAIEGGAELPRVPLTAVGYSFSSHTSAHASHADYAESAGQAQECNQAAEADHALVADALLGHAPDLQCSGCVSPEEVTFNYAGSASQGGPANNLDCNGCVGTGDLAQGAVSFSNLAGNGCVAGLVVKRDQTGSNWVCATDSDTLGGLSCAPDAIARMTTGGWSCDTDRVLTEGQVDAYANNNGYAAQASLQTVALTGEFMDLAGIPYGLEDGDDNTVYTAGFGLLLDGYTFNVNPADVQKRVTGYCSEGQYIRSISADGQVLCGTDANAGGDVTGVVAGTGLLGGGESGQVTLSANPVYLQRRIMDKCNVGESIRRVTEDGTPICETDDNTTYTPGNAMVLNGTVFSVDETVVKGWITGLAFDTSAEVFGICDSRYIQPEEGVITAYMLATGSVGTAEILNGSITSADIGDGTITNTDISSTAAIAYSKLSGVAPSTHTHAASAVTAGTFASGDYTFGNGTLTINAGTSASYVYMNGTVVMNACPVGYELIATNLCKSIFWGTANYTNAQRACYAEGAHICTYEEWTWIWDQEDACPFTGTGVGAWIGNIVGDNLALYANKNGSGDMADFDGTANRSDVRPYRCCMGRGR